MNVCLKLARANICLFYVRALALIAPSILSVL